MVLSLTKAALRLESNERLELAQRLIESVRVDEQIETVLTYRKPNKKILKYGSRRLNAILDRAAICKTR